MSAAFLKLPTNLSSQLSPGDCGGKPLSIERSNQDSLLNDIIQLRLNAAALTGGLGVRSNPVMTPQDRGARGAELTVADFEGEKISCFVVGGEPRLCFPQLLSSVFRTVNLPEMNQGMKELNIHNSVATSAQLEVLKLTGILPMSAANSGLITRSDAERLVSYLLHSRKSHPRLPALVSEADAEKFRAGAIPVAHDCFGGASGLCFPQLLQSPSAECIECAACKAVMALSHFVLHSHRPERTVCHWGFDSSNWRHYLELDDKFRDNAEMKARLCEVKHRFDSSSVLNTGDLFEKTNLLKRKADEMLPIPEGFGGKRTAQLDPLLFNSSSNPFALYDPALFNYYQSVLRYQQLLTSSMALSQLTNNNNRPNSLPFGKLNLKAEKCTSPANSKAALAAAGLLALSGVQDESLKSSQSSSPEDLKPPPPKDRATNAESPPDSVIREHPRQKQGPLASEPLKKHLLHQFARDQKRTLSETAVEPIRPLSESVGSASSSESEDDNSLDYLLAKVIPNPVILQQVRSRIAESQKSLELKIDSLSTQNNNLQQEIAYLRNKQNLLGKRPSGNLLLGNI